MSMEREIQAMIDAHAAFFVTLDFAAISDWYAVPLAVYLGEDLQVCTTREEVMAGLTARVMIFRGQGVKRLVGSCAATDLPKSGSLRVWVQWDYDFGDRIEPCGSQVIYYCRRGGPRGLTIQMLQNTRMLMKDVPPDSHVEASAC